MKKYKDIIKGTVNDMIGGSPQLGIKLFKNQVNYARILL